MGSRTSQQVSPTTQSDLGQPRWRAHLRRHGLLLAILLLGLTVRLTNLQPIFFYGDDAEYATVARSLADDWRALQYPDMEGFGPSPFVSQPPILLYIYAATGALVGDAELGPVLVNVLLGTATIAVVYALGLRLGSRATGVLAAFFLAIFPAHVALSRKGLLDVGLTFFFALTLLCLAEWTRRRTPAWAVATGTAAAATMLSKLYGFLVLVPLAASLAWQLWRPSNTRDARADRRQTSLHAAAATLPIAGLLVAYLALLWHLRATFEFAEKLAWNFGRVSESSGAARSTRSVRPWHWYFSDPSIGLTEQIGILALLLSLVGVYFVLRRSLAPMSLRIAILAWPLAVLLFFTLSTRKEWFYILPAVPALAVLAALPLEAAWRRLPSWILRFEARPRRAAAFWAAGTFLLLALPVAEPVADTAEEIVFDPPKYGFGVEEAAAVIHSQDPEAGQVGTLLGRFALHFYNGHTTYHWYVNHTLVEREIEAGRVRFVVVDRYLNITGERAWLEGLADAYSGTLVAAYPAPGVGPTRVWVYELRP